MSIPVPHEDLLAEEEFAAPKFRRELFPLWMKVSVILLMIGAGAVSYLFLKEVLAERGLMIVTESLSNFRRATAMLFILDVFLVLPAGWMLFREKRSAVLFALIVFSLAILPMGFFFIELMQTSLSYGNLPRLNLDNITLIVPLFLLLACVIRMLFIRREWKNRISKITGR
ncbi:hypothetical protein [Chitinophaga barathri]|uniref:Uncharacterized protein n=1 Tax=Chitinophaga barathri TaxID=1647451 RepID=A0A3N4MQK6_9BACT|nr:hypothetical protein [Chitinophaga barathri]RPD41969.1 hypothetical protein EG028_07370 [Chitinophaga barathri]